MDKIKQAAIIMLTMGENYAIDILKNISPEEVEAVIKAIDEIGSISETDVIEALNDFFKETTSSTIDIVSKEHFRQSLEAVSENKKIEILSNSSSDGKSKAIDVFKLQSSDVIYSILQDEHPQVIAVIATLILTNDKASSLIKRFSKELKSQIISRMAKLGQVSTFAMSCLATFFERELQHKEKYQEISVSGIDAVANIISHLDTESEHDIYNGISDFNKDLAEMIQERVFPFEKLVQLDKRSLQTFLSEVDNDDLVLALKGSDDYVKNIFLKNMASKSADILKDELESKGPVKIKNVIEAQKKLVQLAKRLASEEKIIFSNKVDTDIIF